MTPNEQLGESIAPWLIPTGNQFSRIGEASGMLNKVLTGLRSTGGSIFDWAASNEAQDLAQQYGGNTVAGLLAAIAGASVRHATARTAGTVMPYVFGKQGGGKTYDVNRNIGVTPSLGQVSGPALAGVERAVGDFPIGGASVRSAQDAQKAAVATAANEGLQTIAPGASDVREGSRSTLNTFSEQLGQDARDKIFNTETALKNQADMLETPMKGDRINAQPVSEAIENIITDKNIHPDIRNAAQAIYNDLEATRDSVSNTISFQALKQMRTDLGAKLSNMYPAYTGDPTFKRTMREGVQPIKDAMTDSLGVAADQAGVGPQWRSLDQEWSQHAAMKDDLADVGGVMTRVGTSSRDTRWDAPTSKNVASNLSDAVQGAPSYLDDISRGMGPDARNQAIAEVIASKARPAQGHGAVEFRPDVFGPRVRTEVGQTVRNDLRSDPTTAPGMQRIEDAETAGETSAVPREASGLGRKLAALAEVGGTLTGSIFNPAGTALAHIGAASLEDPSLVRSVAGRGITDENVSPLLRQYASRAGLGASTPSTPNVLPRMWAATTNARPSALWQTLRPYVNP
jgi:hypothetical protein